MSTNIRMESVDHSGYEGQSEILEEVDMKGLKRLSSHELVPNRDDPLHLDAITTFDLFTGAVISIITYNGTIPVWDEQDVSDDLSSRGT